MGGGCEWGCGGACNLPWSHPPVHRGTPSSSTLPCTRPSPSPSPSPPPPPPAPSQLPVSTGEASGILSGKSGNASQDRARLWVPRRPLEWGRLPRGVPRVCPVGAPGAAARPRPPWGVPGQGGSQGVRRSDAATGRGTRAAPPQLGTWAHCPLPFPLPPGLHLHLPLPLPLLLLLPLSLHESNLRSSALPLPLPLALPLPLRHACPARPGCPRNKSGPETFFGTPAVCPGEACGARERGSKCAAGRAAGTPAPVPAAPAARRPVTASSTAGTLPVYQPRPGQGRSPGRTLQRKGGCCSAECSLGRTKPAS